MIGDVHGVSLCGALKSKSFIPSFMCELMSWSVLRVSDIVAVAAGFMDGLGWGDNAKGDLVNIGRLHSY